ncbi:MAG: MogA/MoaB family molybdenum cofactor biosynthesis protein [Clostridiales Family XIII bacterium]|jgi:molybdenum cofactor synthesis domain-containing protein|nr:MogA/MoaB family molybdenum cofactor biosynthesis protein [Clostridiales Family XIII bacterium]
MHKYKVFVITASDSSAEGTRADLSGPAIREMLSAHERFSAESISVLPDDRAALAREMRRLADETGADLILTTGGTGFSKRDVTPEATLDVIERRVPGIPEAMRKLSLDITPRAMLSRAEAGIRGDTLIVNLPGSPKAVREILDFILSSVEHGLDILQGRDGNCAR